MSKVIYLTPEQVAQARSRVPGRHLVAPKLLSQTERARHRRHARRMLAFAEKVRA